MLVDHPDSDFQSVAPDLRRDAAADPRPTSGSAGDLTDLAIGFSLTEGIIETASEIEDVNVVTGVDGVEHRMWLKPGCGAKFKVRQRRLVGPTGCGLCGIENLGEAVKQNPAFVRRISIASGQIKMAVDESSSAQTLNRTTRASHAAGFYSPIAGLVAASAPTAPAVRTAYACGIRLVAIARGREFEIFTHPDGILRD